MENQNNRNYGQGNHDYRTQNFKNFEELDLDENPISQIDEDYETNPNIHLNQENNSSNNHTSNDDIFIENPEDEFNIEDDFNDEDDFDLDKDLNLNDEDNGDDWNDDDQEDLEGNELKRFENSSPETDTTFLNRDL